MKLDLVSLNYPLDPDRRLHFDGWVRIVTFLLPNLADIILLGRSRRYCITLTPCSVLNAQRLVTSTV